ncbi:MAG TPA: amidohydrolase family protein [Bryobacteraceae bacterium]|jgi:imidazolonepropionase-like amidohydrolase|nr:amidohydrolase family protein [Bryobacteraceae bacterium]
MAKLAAVFLFAFFGLEAQTNPIAIVDVTVVPMDRERVIEHQTVVVQDGRIAAIGGSQSVRLPANASQVDGRGKFLMPGLTDMHVHFVREALPEKPQSVRQSGIPASASKDHELENRAYALMFAANGVTTVRNMWGSKTIDALSQEINSGRLIGPHIYSTGPITDGNPPVWESSRIVETPAQAEEAVRSDKQAGYIAIKVYNRLSKDAYNAIVAAARRQGLPVVGHAPASVGLEGAIAAKQDSIEHLDGFLSLMAPGSTAEALQKADLKKLPAIVEAIKAADVWICPTVVVYDAKRTDSAGLEEASFVPPDVFVRYAKMYPNHGTDPRATPQAHALFVAIVAALHSGGAHLLLGTDTMKAGTLPGFSLHEELENFVAAGMTPYQAIRAGTADAAKFLHQENEFGLVRKDLRADLILLNANPFADVKNTSKLAGVLAGGRWYTAAELNQQLAALRSTYPH